MTNKIVISIIILISFLAKNKSMVFAGFIILLLSFLNNDNLNNLPKNYFLNIGMTFLMIWMLSPLLDKENNLQLLNMKSYLNLE
ncbi:hypothetical protein CFK35_19700, partial [Clostridium sp. cpc1]|uniref:DUF441 family protein n=1 Tax=Clostridium sp. cpc1 TaxID=2016536 RepID=UPI0022401C75